MIDEREHRRGLILGLTLAEVLLLLLFVLLLTLAARFKSLQDENKRLTGANTAPIETGSTVPPTDDAAKPGADTGAKGGDGLGIENAALANEFAGIIAKIDPSDPPQVLKHVKTILNLGADRLMVDALSGFAGVKSGLEPGASPKDILARMVGLLQQLDADKRKQMAAAPQKGATITAARSADGDNGKHNWPPIITLSEADGLFFQSGRAELSTKHRDAIIANVVPKMLETVRKYDVNVIEVIGHTDEQPISSRVSDLDKTLASYTRGVPEVNTVVAADNAGLGLARAATVARLLSERAELSKFRILPFSGGQLINVDDTLTEALAAGGQERRRRRIEIRVRRTDKPIEVQFPVAPVSVPREVAPVAKVNVDAKEKKEAAKPATAAKDPQKRWYETIFGP